jgi:hypothetical protein
MVGSVLEGTLTPIASKRQQTQGLAHDAPYAVGNIRMGGEIESSMSIERARCNRGTAIRVESIPCGRILSDKLGNSLAVLQRACRYSIGSQWYARGVRVGMGEEEQGYGIAEA